MTNCLPRLLLMGAVLFLAASPAWTASMARAKADRVNVRSRAGFTGEVITQLQRDQEVRVIGTNVLSDPAADEPATWFMIELPRGASLWVAADYVEPESRKVTADVLNVRAGPGIEYASVGRVPNGTVLETVGAPRDGWLEIAAPEGSIGFVPEPWVSLESTGTSRVAGGQAAPAQGRHTGQSPPDQWSIPSQEGSVPDPARTMPSPTTPPASSPSAAAPPSRLGTIPGAMGATGESANDSLTSRSDYAWFEQFVTPSAAASGTGLPPTVDLPVQTPSDRAMATQETVDGVFPAEPAGDVTTLNMPEAPTSARSDSEEARWVRREGVVIRPFNFAAPSYYGLQARDSGKTVNFLFTTRSEPIPWNEYRGRVVIVTGREYLDRRTYWRGVPVLDVEEIEAVR
jgi:uncharacterized protein YgiM (DUF1202 family)